MPQFIDNKIITLNSAFGVSNNGTMLSNVLFKTGCILEEDTSIIDTHISVVNAQIPVSFYVINSSIHQFRLSLDGVAFVAKTIPVGNYNNYSLISALQLLVGSTFTITFNQVNGIITFSSTFLLFRFDFSVDNSCHLLLGFSKITYYVTTGTLTAPYPLNLLGVKRISIKSYNLGVVNYNSNGGDIVLTTIPADQPPFCMLSFNNQSTDSQLIKVKTIDSIDILLMDEANTLLDFNNVNWTITLKLEIIRFKPEGLSTFKEILNGGSAPHTDTNEIVDEKITEPLHPNEKEGNDEELDFLNG